MFHWWTNLNSRLELVSTLWRYWMWSSTLWNCCWMWSVHCDNALGCNQYTVTSLSDVVTTLCHHNWAYLVQCDITFGYDQHIVKSLVRGQYTTVGCDQAYCHFTVECGQYTVKCFWIWSVHWHCCWMSLVQCDTKVGPVFYNVTSCLDAVSTFWHHCLRLSAY